MSFVHLRVHTEYSLTDGIVRLEPPKRKGGGSGATLVSKAAELKLPALAVTDRNNLFAMVKFYKGAEGAGVKPIVGADVWLEERSASEAPERLTLLVQNEAGYRNLTRLISRSYTDGQSRGQPLIKREWLAGASEGLIALSGRDGGVHRGMLADQIAQSKAAIAELQGLFPGRCYLEVSRCQRTGDEDWVQAAVALGRHTQTPVVATNDVRFLTRAEFNAHEARVCIADGRLLSDEKRPRHYSAEQYLKPADEMCTLFADLPELIENTLHIARRCTLTLNLGKNHLPNYPVPEGHDTNTWLAERARQGLEERFTEITLAQPVEVYRERLEFEIGVIKQMGFAGYFLVVSDFIQWAKQNGCPVGPGRGSGAGSLVAYAIRITDLDPLPYNLLFERFLNPDRVSLPDFDVDFCMDNRDRVIQYVSQKYGRSHVGQIITYATMAARGVVRDSARVLGQFPGWAHVLASLVPATPGATLLDALASVPELKSRYDREEDTRGVLDLALELEGITRGVGVHAGGVVIAPQALTDYAPLYCEAGGEGLRTQFDMKDLETVGLVKFDFLGLKTLTIIQHALDSIAESGGPALDMLKLPLDDPRTYALYASGDTAAVFQMESPGMQRASRDLKPDRFEDIVALVSLYRPGPMENIPEFCARKRGDVPITYLHPDMQPVLEPTYGIFVYQEQVMQMSQRLAGYSLGGADLLRRAMGKKIKAEMDKQRGIFTEGAIARGVPPETATSVFDLMAKFADYGFNKSHAAAYALVSYHTAWLKTHYPAEFMAAVMSCDLEHTDTIVDMRDECRRMGMVVHAPDINRSHLKFTVPAPGQIHHGLGAIKGVGAAALEGILAERAANGPFTDLFNFCRRIDLKKANKRVLEALTGSGALDALGPNRASLMATLPDAIQTAERAAENASSGQNDLFGGGSRIEQKPAMRVEREWPLAEKLKREQETLGFYLTGHPIEAWRDVIQQVCSGTLKEIIGQQGAPAAPGPDGKRAWQPRSKSLFAAWVTDIRFFKADLSKGDRGRASYKVTLDDQSAQLSTWVDADQWSRYQNIVKPDGLIFVIAEVSLSPGRDGRPPEPRLYKAEFYSPDQILADYAYRLVLQWKRPPQDVTQLQKLLAPHRMERGAQIALDYVNGKSKALLELPAEWRIKLSTTSLDALRLWLGTEAVRLQARKYQPPVSERRFERSNAGGFDDE